MLACLLLGAAHAIGLLAVLLSRARSACLPEGCHPTAQTDAFKARSSLQITFPCDPGSLPAHTSTSKERSWGKDVKSCYSMCSSLYKRIHFHSPACLLQSKHPTTANSVLCHGRPQRANAWAAAVCATSLRTAAVLSPYRSSWGCLRQRPLGARSSPRCESCLPLHWSFSWALQLAGCKAEPCQAGGASAALG